ncbi:ABC-2 type transport system permease protein [Modestobacter sp. DSM 44400]|uniref:ABC transporter permease n=1 Tax=Modestobacter sp. DSM 44400 TaxID=1550230 RepID=UPI000894DA67|nr:ABC-2 family transporter protein [Modestobacter sp. DSM 44400]SDY29803.1 ABC-2 type transport system permease protein [Modestobacter sp. DSM 44400]
MTQVARAGERRRLTGLAGFYAVVMRTAVQTQFQYRTANYLYMVGMIAEPVIYLVVWSAVAEAQGGSVEGITAGEFAAYYIVWTLVRNMNIVFTPYGWEGRIRKGELSGMLVRPVHPIHYDLAYFAGWKFVVILLWVPIAAVLSLVFRPTFDVSALELLVFLVAIWGAYLIRSMLLWALGMVTFWTTRVSALYELYFTAELLLSGRLLPLALLPGWAMTIADWTPFQYTFGFPIEVLAGDLSTGELWTGLGLQAVWTAIGALLVAVVWRFGIRRYSAVGN